MIYYAWICLQSGCRMCYHSGWREWYSMIRYRSNVDVLAMLNAAGYSSYRMRQERILGERVIQKIRERKLPSWQELDKLCGLLRCHPVDLLEYIPDAPRDAPQPTKDQPWPIPHLQPQEPPQAFWGFSRPSLDLLYDRTLHSLYGGHRGLQETQRRWSSLLLLLLYSSIGYSIYIIYIYTMYLYCNSWSRLWNILY